MDVRRLSLDSVDVSACQESVFEPLQPNADRISNHSNAARSSSTTMGQSVVDDTAPFLRKGNQTLSYDNYNRRHDLHSSHQQKCDWLPVTLRLPFLTLLTTVSLALGFGVLALTVYSMQYHGLGVGSDGYASIIFFGWRFSPTLIVTIYGILVASLLNDVRRTEIFARMSRSGGASASTTLCFPARSWWNDPFDALNKRTNNGVYSWALLLTSLSYILVLLVLAPLSAGLLAPASIQYRRSASFNRAHLADNFTWQTDSWDLTSFRTISGAVLNQSTSAWLSDHLILPFWPLDLLVPPLGSSFGGIESQQWSAETDVYKAELNCVPMELLQIYDNVTVSHVERLYNGSLYTSKTNTTIFELDSHDGCRISITGEHGYQDMWVEHGGGWWANRANYSVANTPHDYSNATDRCEDRALIFAKGPGFDVPSTGIQAHICSRSIYSASIMVNVTINQSSTSVTFNQDEFRRERAVWQLEGHTHNHSSFEQAFLSPDWATKFPHFAQDLNHRGDDDVPWFDGPLLPIAVDHANNATEVVGSVDIAHEVSRLYQQFFGEMLLLALQSKWMQKETLGQITMLDRRISVSAGIGLTIGLLFMFLACFITLVTYHTRLIRRPLNLHQDPGGIAAAASLMTDHKTRSDFLGTDHVSKRALKARLDDHTFSMEYGKLLFIDGDTNEISRVDRDRDPRPVLLRGWMGPVLLLTLFALIAALFVLFHMSRAKAGIHQSAFVYQLSLDVLGATTTMAPYSIIPTLCAVGIKLWFEAIGDVFKRLQPYITMSKAPTKLPNSVLAEYVNTPTPFVSVKAIQHSHWLLVMIGLGALATEVFTVGMSALWELEIRNINNTFSLPRRLALRNTPIVFPWSRDARGGPYFSQPQNVILPTVYTKAVQSWLYGAVVEISQSASTPSWTKDDWSFLPLDLSDLQDVVSPMNGLNTWYPGKTRNVTFQTTAVRASLRCMPLDFPNNKSAWIEKLDFHDPGWNASNRPHGLIYGYTLIGPANALGDSNFTCCANETDGIAGDAAVGYWMNYDQSSKSYQDHLSATWIVGRPLNGTFQSSKMIKPLWIWPEEPRLFATNCTPVIEQAEAHVTAEVETGTILEYNITSQLENATVAWSDDFLEHRASVDYGGEAFHYTLQEENVTVRYDIPALIHIAF
jgi:hypothetical protein